MSKPFPAELRRDFITVLRKHEAPIAQIARNYGISSATLHNFLKNADVEEGILPGVSAAETADLPGRGPGIQDAQ
ncbi:hypothetical protein SAMN04489740_1111 [Arthrobacter alpinus]|uniref:Transposase n=1 Tax=Arthrobacter alpinus TaxID=656366 RepID=A0A1H5HWL8_9MICC|nr:hypothetical protein SAMN04489740_1111 [Arthrobacter alpinus]